MQQPEFLSLKVRWYVIANRTAATIYQESRESPFHLIEEFSNPRALLQERQLDSDKPGRGYSSAGGGTIRHALDRRSAHHELEVRRFARKVARFLQTAHSRNRFTEMVLVAEPHFLGILRNALSVPMKSKLIYEIPHEYISLTPQDLQFRIKRELSEAG